ncbi:MAG: carboxylesterase/lipase family protein, partial [Lachnospiraceae bacterium]|nr:carboxylesterase/lipase family protein [Lachnospiraceae bacterium]
MSNTIMTKCGEIRGTTCQWDGVTAYKGIRYATAGRWEYPQMVTHWEGVYEAEKYGNCSYQPRAFYNEEEVVEKAFYYNEFRKGETYTYDDDCLFLNIWVPETATPESKLPVIFYIHGGGYTGGCGHEKHFDGPVWPTRGVIAVTCNYRLGPMGYLCLPELEKEAGHTGNYGMFDQITALQWVKNNIEAFGGNPENITLMGQSAGAMSTLNLCISPLTDGLFAKAVMNSGGGVHKLMDSKATTKDRFEFWQKVMDELNISTVKELREMEIGKVFAAWQKIKKTSQKYGMIASPCIDGIALTESGLAVAEKGGQKNIPYMMGSTSQDIVPTVVHGMAKNWCIMQEEQKKQPG